MYAHGNAKCIPSQRHHVYPIVQFVDNQRGRSTGCIPQVDPDHFRVPCIPRKSDSRKHKCDPDIANEHCPMGSNLAAAAWSPSQGDCSLDGQEKEHA